MTHKPGSIDAFEVRVVDLMRKRDARCIDLLYDKYGPALYGIAIKIVEDDSTAQDVVQDSFIKVWKRCDSFNPEKSKVFTWLYSIVRNTAIDKLRSIKNRRTTEIQNDDSSVSLATDQVVKPDSLDIPIHLAKLDEKYRVIVWLMYFKGFTQQEVSEKLDMPLGTVKTRLRIALRELRKIYVDDDA